MATISLNDIVTEWGLNNGYNDYNEAKAALIGSLTPNEVADYGGADSWNAGLYNLADVPAVLSEATLWLDSRYSVTGEPRVINQGTGGSALNAKYGSVLGAYVYDGAAVLPGLASNYLSVPDEADLSVSGPIEIVARLNPTVLQGSDFINKRTAAAQLEYSFEYNVLGQLVFRRSYDGTTWGSGTTTSTAFLVAGTPMWVKVTQVPSTGALAFYSAPDSAIEPTSWTARGTATQTIGTPFSGTGTANIGSAAASQFVNGSIYRTIVRNGIDGTTVLDVDLTDVADYATSFTATTGQTVTVNSTSSDTNDPLFLPHTGENYAYFPGVASNTLSVPDEAALDITGDIEIVVRCISADWAAAAARVMAAKYNSTGNQKGWAFRFKAASRTLQFYQSTLGSDDVLFEATALADITNSTAYWFKVTFDVDNGAGGRTARFYQAADQATEPSSWTQIGSAVTVASTTATFANTSLLTLGALGDGTSTPFTGSIYRTIIRNGIDGTTVLDIDCPTDITDAGATSFTATSGQTVTVARATSGRRTALVTRPIWLFGTDDTLRLPVPSPLLDFSAAQSFSVLAVVRPWGTAETGRYFSNQFVGNGFYLGKSFDGTGAAFTVSTSLDTKTAASGATAAVGVLRTSVGVRDVGAAQLRAYLNGVAGASVATPTIEDAFNATYGDTVGASGSYVHDNLNGELVALAIWDRVLTTDEIAAINTYYNTA